MFIEMDVCLSMMNLQHEEIFNYKIHSIWSCHQYHDHGTIRNHAGYNILKKLYKKIEKQQPMSCITYKDIKNFEQDQIIHVVLWLPAFSIAVRLNIPH